MAATKKKGATKRVSAPKLTVKSAAKETGPTAIDPSTLDARHDGRAPDASVTTLVTHAEALAESVRSLKAPLAKAKVSLGDADRLDALAALLREREESWQAARKASHPGNVAAARTTLTAGRTDLFGALDAFVDGDEVAEELAAVGGVDDDDDLDDDAARLIKLARRHAAALEGTEITPAKVDEVEAALRAFRTARKGVVSAPQGETRQKLAEDARVALELRNRVFWALSALDRTVCKRGRYCFRAQPARRAAFAAYATEPARARRPAPAPAPPPTP